MDAVIAIYGAILASVVFAWQVFAWMRNRYRLRLMVDIQPTWEVGHDAPTSHEIAFRIINVGSQPVTILRCGFYIDKRDPRFVLRRGLEPGVKDPRSADSVRTYLATESGTPEPRVVEPAGWHEWRLPASTLEVGPVRAWAEDASGKRHTSQWLKSRGEAV